MPQVIGIFKTLKNGSMTLRHDGRPDSTHTVSADATVLIGGNEAKLADLQAGDNVALSGDPVTAVSASR